MKKQLTTTSIRGFILLLTLFIFFMLCANDTYAVIYKNSKYSSKMDWNYSSKSVETIQIKITDYKATKKCTTFKTKVYWSWNNAPVKRTLFTGTKNDSISVAAYVGSKKCTVLGNTIKGHVNYYRNAKKKKGNKDNISFSYQKQNDTVIGAIRKNNHIFATVYPNFGRFNKSKDISYAMDGYMECKWKISGKHSKASIGAMTRSALGKGKTKAILDGLSISVSSDKTAGASLSYKFKTVKSQSPQVRVGN